eukprot:TRINITY_DN43_c0_g1_i1.p1 TRINITY_DN43_c0_g1~~TRINITY_DN43_c0_g1_i1.p1  ORF type:complete len:633 (+),score=188.48 TRINITY_DN43_c0_g1_i1:105-2003(+)
MPKPRAGSRGHGAGGGAGSKRGGRGGAKKSGIEKYGFDAADKALRLHDDKVLSDEEEAEEDGLEEDVMALGGDDDDYYAEGGEDDGDQDDAAVEVSGKSAGRQKGSVTAGWQKNDFYGGEDAGDDSSAGSDEELVLEEARKLEEVRAARLQGNTEDVLSTLIGSAPVEEPTGVQEGAAAAAAPADGAVVGAQFDALFAGEAERASVTRDLSQLSDVKKRGIMKKEAPELLPLLEDFKSKLAGLQELMPLLSPAAMKQVPASGVHYLQARAALLLNTLANLSFYLLLRAEGGEVRAHPVISQLVWLRELHEKLAPLDKQLGPRLKKALKAAKSLAKLGTDAAAALPRKVAESESDNEAAEEVPAQAPKRMSLRERLDQLRRTTPKVEGARGTAGSSAAAKAAARAAVSATDLLRLPVKRSKARKGSGAADGPDDLEEADPSLGFRRLGATLGEQVSSVRQLLGERAAKERVVSADGDVEARPRRVREKRMEELPFGPLDGTEGSGDEPFVPAEEDEDALLQAARGAAKAKKAKKASEQDAKERERAAKQFKPEEVLDGRRKTSKQILANRGLVRQRKRTAGNARVTNRTKYDKMVKRRKGAVQDMREGAFDGATYAGEATGVRTHVKKSLKLG